MGPHSGLAISLAQQSACNIHALQVTCPLGSICWLWLYMSRQVVWHARVGFIGAWYELNHARHNMDWLVGCVTPIHGQGLGMACQASNYVEFSKQTKNTHLVNIIHIFFVFMYYRQAQYRYYYIKNRQHQTQYVIPHLKSKHSMVIRVGQHGPNGQRAMSYSRQVNFMLCHESHDKSDLFGHLKWW